MREALERWINQQRGINSALIGLRRITTGHSRAMWSAEFSDGALYVVRIEQGGVFGTSGLEEFRFMRAAHRLGVKVATVRWQEPTGRVLGQPFFVMDFIAGATTRREERVLADSVARNFVSELHQLHGVDWSSELPTPGPPEHAIAAQIDRWLDVYRASVEVPVPLLEEGAAWLHHHCPALKSVAIVHGDPGPGNFVHDGAQVVALTDWEFAHLGDPIEDWVYLITMRGSRTKSCEEWVTLIAELTDVPITEADLAYWGAFNFFKGACANLSCLRSFAGPNPAPNMAIIGTALQQTFMRQMATLTGG